MSEVIGPLGGSGKGSCNFRNQIAVKNSVKLSISNRKNGGGTARILDYGGTEKTEEDGTVTVTIVNYQYSCSPAEPPGVMYADSANWAPGLRIPNYRIAVPTSGRPGGSIEITISWQVYVSPPEKPTQGQTKEQWKKKKVVLNEGIDVEVIDDAADYYGKTENKFPDIIDLYVSDIDSAERKGQSAIWDSVKKRDGYIQAKFNPYFVPGDVFLTSDSSQKAYDLKFLSQGIDFSWKSRGKPICKYLFKENYFNGE